MDNTIKSDLDIDLNDNLDNDDLDDDDSNNLDSDQHLKLVELRFFMTPVTSL